MAINKNKVMDAARKAYEKGQYDKAIKEYLKVVREDPKDVRVWLKIGDLYAKKGAKQEATDTYLKVATFYSEQGFYLKAVAVYKQILKLDPRLVEVNLKLAELYRQLGLLSDAMQHFEMVAAFFHREGNTKEALATIRQLVELDPENVATRIKLAELYSKEGMVPEAVTEFGHACEYLRKHNRQDDYIKVAERLLFHKSDDIALCRELASLYLRREDPRRALAKLQICFKAEPRDVDTLGLLAQAFQKLEQKGKTVSVLKELARILSDRGERSKAEEVHRKILAYVPSDPDSKAFLGDAASPAAAVPAPRAERSAPMRPSDPLGLSGALDIPNPRYTGGTPIARRTGAMPLVREPSDVEESLGESSVADERGSNDDAFELDLDESAQYEAVEGSSVGGEMHADEIEKVLTETDVYVKYGLHQKAIDHLRRIFDLDPENVEARERLKDILLGQGRSDEAVRELMVLADTTAPANPERAAGYLRELLAIDPSHQAASELARRHRLDVGDDPGDDAGALAAVDDDLDFDDLDFDDGAAQVGAIDDAFLDELDEAVAPASAGVTRREADVGYPFHAADKASITMEVSIDQVEDAVSVADAPGDDLDFDIAPPGDPLAPHQDLVAEAYPADELPFDPADAAAFDAERPASEVAAGDAHLDFEPEATPFEPRGPGDGVFGAPASYEPPSDGPVFGATDREVALVDESMIGDEVVDDALVDVEESEILELGGDDVVELSPSEIREFTSDDDFDLASDPGRDSVTPTDVASETDYSLDLGDEPAPATADAGNLEDDLDEADFFVSQGLLDEARDILDGLLVRHPGHPLITAKLHDLDQIESGAHDAESDFAVDSFLAEESSAPAQTRSVVLEKPVDDEDADTHYDLGLAYKEMGLLDEAVKAFQKVMHVPGREVQCHLMIGLCHREQGNLSEAISQFKAGLYVDSITPAEKFGLYYEIGAAYEGLEDPQEALYYYEMVLKKDPAYRDVSTRVAAIKARGGGGTRRGRDDETDDVLDRIRLEGTDRSR